MANLGEKYILRINMVLPGTTAWLLKLDLANMAKQWGKIDHRTNWKSFSAKHKSFSQLYGISSHARFLRLSQYTHSTSFIILIYVVYYINICGIIPRLNTDIAINTVPTANCFLFRASKPWKKLRQWNN